MIPRPRMHKFVVILASTRLGHPERKRTVIESAEMMRYAHHQASGKMRPEERIVQISEIGYQL